ncbi:MAG: hypothetical protein JW749_07220 [Sedimentisphaerales bacterium]|nr:hypothetical protein [Sedimentisphaerales bacterium]
MFQSEKHSERADEYTPRIYDGQTAVLDVKRKKNRKFWKQRNGRQCTVISCHRNAAIVAIPSLNELVLCQTNELRPAVL